MDESNFEGTIILERLASLNLVDDFFDAIDSDDKREVVSLLKQAEIDDETITIVIDMMEN